MEFYSSIFKEKKQEFLLSHYFWPFFLISPLAIFLLSSLLSYSFFFVGSFVFFSLVLSNPFFLVRFLQKKVLQLDNTGLTTLQ